MADLNQVIACRHTHNQARRIDVGQRERFYKQTGVYSVLNWRNSANSRSTIIGAFCVILLAVV